MMPVFWGLYKGEPEIGVTIHYMDEKLDSGNIIKQEKVPVNNRSLHRMILKTKRMSALLVHKTLNDIMNGKLESVPMPKGGSYQTFPTPDEVKEFKRRGNKIL
jgi:methionyl-tRNA formyltransferase